MSSRSLRRLKKEFERIQNNDDFLVYLEDESSIYKWIIVYKNFDDDTNIYKQFQENEMENKVVIEFTMDNEYPRSPPKARILEPRFVPGFSFVLDGGAICIDILSPNNWTPMITIETSIYSIVSLLSTNDLKNKIVKGKYSKFDGEKSYQTLKRVHSEWWRKKR